jgi:hypothetical protein
MARITTIPLFKNLSLSAGDSGTSDIIDLRYCSSNGKYSLNYQTAVGTSGTCGTTTFSYVGCSIETGTFVSPVSGGTFGTSGTGKTEAKLMSFGTDAPVLTPFMKIIATQTGAGTAGANSKITAELNVQ